jgi:hypothetical protein
MEGWWDSNSIDQFIHRVHKSTLGRKSEGQPAPGFSGIKSENDQSTIRGESF